MQRKWIQILLDTNTAVPYYLSQRLAMEPATELRRATMTASATVAAAIAESVTRNDIIDVPYDAEVADELLVLSDDSADTEAVTEYWGTTEDGDPWRVHMARE
jgi:hypothetical protein